MRLVIDASGWRSILARSISFTVPHPGQYTITQRSWAAGEVGHLGRRIPPASCRPPRGQASPLCLLLGKAHHGADAYAELPRDAEDAKALSAHRADRFHLCRIATLEARPAERNTVLSSSRQA
jgi:hypothetical protein